MVAGGGIIKADAADLLVGFLELTGVPISSTLMGSGVLPDDHELNTWMVGLRASHFHGNVTTLESNFVLGTGDRCANRHTVASTSAPRGARSCASSPPTGGILLA